MTADSEGLHEIANTENADRVADIVFVHGLAGGSHSTWRHAKKGQAGYFFWPEELGRKLPHCGVWCVGYAAGLTRLGKPGMIIEKRAGNIASQLTMRGLGDRPVVFITHSMGGLVVKSLIVNSQLHADSARKRLAAAIRGVVFCGTPHRGSAFASAVGVLGASQRHVKEMEANVEQLDLLHDQFLAWYQHNPIAIESYAESIGLGRTNWYGRALPLGLVVNRSSANPNIGTIHDVDADHLALVKPTPDIPAVYDLVYRGVLRFIETVLDNAMPFSVPRAAVDLTPNAGDLRAIGSERSKVADPIVELSQNGMSFKSSPSTPLDPNARVREPGRITDESTNRVQLRKRLWQSLAIVSAVALVMAASSGIWFVYFRIPNANEILVALAKGDPKLIDELEDCKRDANKAGTDGVLTSFEAESLCNRSNIAMVERTEDRRSENTEALFELGANYNLGTKLPQNYTKAKRYLARAALRGDSSSALLLGALYLSETDDKRDYVKAIILLEEAGRLDPENRGSRIEEIERIQDLDKANSKIRDIAQKSIDRLRAMGTNPKQKATGGSH